MLKYAIALLAVLAIAAGAAHAGELPVSACAPITSSPESERYQLHGTTRLALTLDKYGVAKSIAVQESSGWTLLDQQAIKLAGTCRFRWDSKDGILVVPSAPVSGGADPDLIEGSCLAGSAFREVAHDTPGAIKVRLMVWTDGKAYAPRLEGSSGNAAVDRWLLAKLHECRYDRRGTPAHQTTTAKLYLDFDRSQLEPPALRALYQKWLPAALRAAAGEREFQLRSRTYRAEAPARAELNRLQAGGAFDRSDQEAAAVAKPLAWMRFRRGASPVADAVRAATRPGPLADIVHIDDEWVVVQVHAIRPAEPMSYEESLPLLKAAAVIGNAVQDDKDMP